MLINSSTNGGTSVNNALNGEVFSMFNPVSASVVLPVKLSIFSAEQYKERASKLNWSTSSEINSDFFGVERSEDGVNWSNIGRVRAAGNSNETLKYEYIDNSLPLNRSKEQIFYYRLKMTDLDGKYEYSDIRGVNFQRTATTTSISIYPNPSTDRINVDLSGMDLNNGEIVLSVFDMKGQQMIRKNIIGNGLELIDVNQLPAATYNVVVQQKDKVFQQRIIKID
ncbi:MAG: T9SS type A sorting domain-containing protein [Saprospiraceae bacterium]|nr:T9SS type A sorting domain-containing protein [Saprospiraceae bacterium]